MKYDKDHRSAISFPLGGIGTGCIGLAGSGHLVDWEIANHPNKCSTNRYSHFAIKAEADGTLLDARILNGDLPPPYMGNTTPAEVKFGGHRGFGYGAAIGAQMALGRDARVVMLTGDGSFHMNLNEACTAVSYDLPIITVIFNNQVLGMVRQWQTTFYEKRYSDTDPHRKTDFVKLAEGFGAKGYRAATPAEFKAAFADAMKQKGPSWIDCRIGKDEKVLPMIPGGGTVNDIIME